MTDRGLAVSLVHNSMSHPGTSDTKRESPEYCCASGEGLQPSCTAVIYLSRK